MIPPVLTFMYREYRIRITSPIWLFWDFVVPFLYLLLFGVGMQSAFDQPMQMNGRLVPYNDFFLAGVLGLSSLGIAVNASYGLFVDRDNGIFYEFLTYPMAQGSFLIGKILFNICTSVLQAVCLIALSGTLFGVAVRWDLALLAIPVVIAGTAGWFFFAGGFAFVAKRNDTFNTYINLVYFVMMFASSIFYPLDRFPGWLRTLSYWTPMTWMTDALRYCTIGAGDPGTVALECAGLVLFMAVSFWAALRMLRRSV